MGTAVAFAVVSLCAAWVFWDARARGLSNGGGMGPWGWGLCTLCVWVVAFPLYLLKRRKMPPAQGADAVAIVGACVFLAPGALAVAAGALAGGLPACSDPSVVALATQVLREGGGTGALSEFAEVQADTSSARRVCRTKVSAATGESMWLTFTVEPHGDGMIFVKYGAP